MKRPIWWLAGPAVMAVCLSLVPQLLGQSTEETPAVLAGDWRLDPTQSEDLGEKLRNSRGGGLPGGLGPRPGGIGAGAGGRGGRGGVGGSGADAGGGLMQVLRPPQQLSFEAGPDQLIVRTDLGLARPIHLDGRETVDTLGDLSVRTSKAKWKKGKLEIERKAGDFARVQETYWVDPKTGSMVVDVKVENGPRKVSGRRIYQRVAKP